MTIILLVCSLTEKVMIFLIEACFIIVEPSLLTKKSMELIFAHDFVVSLSDFSSNDFKTNLIVL